jgi:hypothetical protein
MSGTPKRSEAGRRRRGFSPWMRRASGLRAGTGLKVVPKGLPSAVDLRRRVRVAVVVRGARAHHWRELLLVFAPTGWGVL